MKVGRMRAGWVLSGKVNVEAKQVFCLCFLAKSCQSFWKQSFVLGSFFFKKISSFRFEKIILDGPGFQTGFSASEV